MNKLAFVYTKKLNRIIVVDFPLAKQFVSKRIKYPSHDRLKIIERVKLPIESRCSIETVKLPITTSNGNKTRVIVNTVPAAMGVATKIQLPKFTKITKVQGRNPTENVVFKIDGKKPKVITEAKQILNKSIEGSSSVKTQKSISMRKDCYDSKKPFTTTNSAETQKYFSHKRQLVEIDVWNKFCHFSKKTSNFTEKDVIGFFESLYQKQESGIYAAKSRLETMYLSKTTRVLTKDFPNVDNFITNLYISRRQHDLLKPKLNQFIQTYETVWKTFCDLSQKSEGFVEEDVIRFFETLLQKKTKPSTCSIYR